MNAVDHRATAGFTLAELLVAMGVAGVLLAVLSSEFVVNARTYLRMSELIEVQQGVRAVLSELTQEVRQAGACLPTGGAFVAMSGKDLGDRDTFTIRTGRVRSDLTCIRPTLSAAAFKGDQTLTVNDTSGVEEGDWLYILPTAATGAYYHVTAVGVQSITLDKPLLADLPDGSVVYSIEERTYAIADVNGFPMLTVSIDAEDPVDLVPAVESLNLRYGLEPCPPCDEVDEPADDTEWRLVRSISVDVTVNSGFGMSASHPITATGSTKIHPRNFL
jgi:prepilin-type N-terminal cleavage/methylation domain-containing protein